ncbi:MAG: ABC transporter ATP-binding protein/permease [Clostridiales Family XIII bacterium]|jgi:ATP-binding cassette subfamily B protein|nr:ABC transporter ATP-binding protein/permease [Clostridiales Family XIII bacterium]
MGGQGPMGGGPFGGMGGGGAKSKDFKGTMMTLLKYLAVFRAQISAVIVFAIFSTVFSIAGPKILGKATTKLFEGMIAYFAGTGLLTDIGYIARCILILVALYLISSVFSYIQGYVMAGVSMKITYRFRKDISEKINRLPLRYFDRRTHGEVLSRITNDIDTVSQTLNQSLTQIVTSVTMILGILGMMLSISLLMTLVTVLVIPLSSVFIMIVVKQSQKHFRKQQEYLGHINGHVEETYTGHNIVQVFNREEEAMNTFNGLNDELYNSAWKSQFLSGMMMPIMNFVGNLSYVIICILGGYLAVKSSIEVGDIQAFIQYSRNFMQPVGQLANISNILQSTAAAAERVFEFLAEEEESPENAVELKRERIRGQVSFKNVHFGYSKDKTIINNFSSVIHPGDKVAIVGPTGAGKTTIVKLLMRFYDIDGGAIFIDDYDINRLSRGDLRSLFGMVLQDAWLYSATIMENIRYGNFDKSDEDVIAAAKAARCDEFINQLPDGYNMVINEDAGNISQGQKQLLTIARTFLADPPVLILDEATSSVDTRTEVLVQQAMTRLLRNRTSFVIAHRLSTIRDADIILVMKDGDIIEQGTHGDLLAQGGFYAELYMSQFSEGE